MNYNNFFKWDGFHRYSCTQCNEVVDAEQRRRHMGKHLKVDEYNKKSVSYSCTYRTKNGGQKL